MFVCSGLDKWDLTAVEQLASSCKSVCISLATITGGMPLEETLEAARLEEDYQIGHWGLVEGGHDIDLSDSRVRISAPSIFVRLIRKMG